MEYPGNLPDGTYCTQFALSMPEIAAIARVVFREEIARLLRFLQDNPQGLETGRTALKASEDHYREIIGEFKE